MMVSGESDEEIAVHRRGRKRKLVVCHDESPETVEPEEESEDPSATGRGRKIEKSKVSSKGKKIKVTTSSPVVRLSDLFNQQNDTPSGVDADNYTAKNKDANKSPKKQECDESDYFGSVRTTRPKQKAKAVEAAAAALVQKLMSDGGGDHSTRSMQSERMVDPIVGKNELQTRTKVEPMSSTGTRGKRESPDSASPGLTTKKRKVPTHVSTDHNTSGTTLTTDLFPTPPRAEQNSSTTDAKSPSAKSPSAKSPSTKSPSAKSPSAKSGLMAIDTQVKLPLRGYKIVLTGVCDRYPNRDDAENHIKALGGIVTSAVSGVTDFLVTGNKLEDGREIEEGSKYRKATQLTGGQKTGAKSAKVQIVTAEEFFSKFDACERKPANSDENLSPISIAREGRIDDNRLWVEVYRPHEMEAILGNGDVVRKLFAWLTDWKNVCLHGNVKPLPKPVLRHGGRFAEPENLNARAALLSGPPGVGKSTAAHVIARRCGYDPIEFNASDDRGKAVVEMLSDMTGGGRVISKGKSSEATCVILDEIDGLAERGAPQAIIKLLTSTKSPVICICNDRMHPKVRSIASKCYDLKFSRPPKNLIARRVCQIARNENVDVEPNGVELLCEYVGNDIRQVLNTLQLLSGTKSEIAFGHVKQETDRGVKDRQVMTSPFDVAKQFLSSTERTRMNFNQQIDAFFVDFDLIPLLINENYLTAIANDRNPPIDQIDRMARVADMFTFGDCLNFSIRRNNNWRLLPDFGLFTCIAPAATCRGWLMRPEFPRWLGKNSTTNKARRLLHELQLYLSPVSTCTPVAMVLSGYLDTLYEMLLRPLLSAEVDCMDAVCQCIRMLDEYGLSRDQLIESFSALRLKSQTNLYELVDPKVKTALTRHYKKTTHNIRMVHYQVSARHKPTTPSDDAFAETSAPARELEEEEQDEDDNQLLDKLIVNKKKSTASAKAKARLARGESARTKSRAKK